MKPKKPRIVPFAILTTITFLTWATLDVWRTFQKPAPFEIEENILKEFNPNLEQESLRSLENRIFFTNEEARNSLSLKTPTPQATNSSELDTSQEGATQ